MKTRLPREQGTGRINTLVKAETYRNVLMVSVETSRTVSSAVDYLLRMGLKRYLELKAQDENAENGR